MSPRVSVILTVYKRVHYLPNALRSVLAQSYRDFEIIVADDSGVGAAREVVAEFASSNQIKYLRNSGSLGVAASLARASEQARGEFIAILNDDDLWEQDLLERLVLPLIADRNRVVASSDHWLMDADGRINNTLTEAWTANFGRAGLLEGIIPNPVEFAVKNGGVAINLTCVFRKDALDWSLVAPKVKGAYDYWISCLLAATRRPFYFVPKRLASWRVHDKMETERRSHDKNENLVYIYSTLLERGWFPELSHFLRTRLADSLFEVGRDKLHFDRASEARACFWRCFVLERRPRAFICTVAACLPSGVRTLLKGLLGSLENRMGKEHKRILSISATLDSRSLEKINSRGTPAS